MKGKAKRWADRVASIGCIICKDVHNTDTPAQLHHIGDTAERNDFLCIPLCQFHHTGGGGFHGLGERAFNRTYRTSELALLARVIEELA